MEAILPNKIFMWSYCIFGYKMSYNITLQILVEKCVCNQKTEKTHPNILRVGMNKEQQKEEVLEHQLILLKEKKQEMASLAIYCLNSSSLYFSQAFFTTFWKYNS